MAKSTKVMDLAASMNMEAQQLIEQINALGLGFSVRAKTSGLTDEQVQQIQRGLNKQQTPRTTSSAIDAKSQSTGKGTVRIRRRREDDASKSSDESKPAEQKPETPKPTVKVRKAAKPEAAQVADKRSEAVVETPKVEPVAVEAPKSAEVTAEPKASETVEVASQNESAAKELEEPVAAPVVQKSEPVAKEAASEKPKAETESKPEKQGSKDKKDKKKDRKKNENVISLGPKLEKGNILSLTTGSFGNNSFSDSIETYQDSEDTEEEEAAPRPENNRWKQGKQNRKVIDDNDDLGTEEDDEDATDTSNRKKISGPSNILGKIDPTLIKAMLIKDNKKFVSDSGGNNDKPTRKSGSRTVVNSSQFYNKQERQNSNQGHSGTSFKKVTRPKKGAAQAERVAAHPQASEHKRVVKVSENISVGALANDLGVKAGEVIKFLMKELGMMVTVNQTVDVETAELVAAEYGFTVQDVSFKEEAFTESENDKPEDLELRAPIVTVMGHVDHGKTSLLDAIRKSRVAAGEAGGITQHIGASSIDTPNGKVVFLDTPGHEAFTSLRARGAKVTDLVVLVVAADDGVMPQTVEAINHAKAANVPIIVAINKIDKPGANPERVRQALTEYELIPEEWGGSTIFKEVSAKQGTGVDELLELIQLQSEVLELKANPDKPARGFVLEAYKDNRKGTVASILVQEGTLRINDILVSGACYGKVKSMTNERGKNIRVAEPSTPVEITGLSDVPDAGEPFFIAKDEKIAKEFTTQIKERKRNAELSSKTAKRFDIWSQFDNKTLNVILKTDVQGSLEALVKSLGSLSTDDVKLEIVHAAVGGASENDVQLAVASNAIIIGFNTRPDARAAEIAKREGIIIESFNIIYDVIDYVKDAMSGLLDPIIGENVLGHVEIRNTFNVPKVGTIAGGYVTDGIIKRGAKCRLLRQGKIIYDSKVASLKRFKDDAKEVRTGFECGFSIENYNDVKVDDVVEVYEITETKQSL